MIKNNLCIFLVRHAQKENSEGPLTKLGIKQARAISSRLNNLKFEAFYSSDLLRCKETAEIINKKLKKKILFSDKLREVPLEVKNNPSRYKKEILAIKKIWKQILSNNGNVLVVSSGVVNKILIGLALNIPFESCNFIHHNTGITRLFFHEKKFLAEYINDTSHLSEALRERKRD